MNFSIPINTSIITIAIADDHNLIRGGIISLINEFPNCKVIKEAANGRELINKIATIESPPDICILDISMPVLNGYDTALQLKKIYPEMKFLALTAYNNQYSIIRMIKNGANGYLLKSCLNDDLHNAINSINHCGYYYSTVASEKAFKAIKNNELPDLKVKEVEFLRLCCSELQYAKIAEIMCVSTRTVEDYHKNICEKLNVHSRVDLVLFAMQSGLVSIS